MSSDLETRALLGRNVNDTYGRNIGRVIGLDRNHFGELEAIQVEATAGQIISAKARQLSVTPKTVSLTPDWKIEVNDILHELDILHKRLTALESLKETGEIADDMYQELLNAQKKGYGEKKYEIKQLVEVMTHKLATINNQISSLTKYLASIKLDHKSGLLDSSSFQIAEQSIKPTLQSLILEKNDLNDSIKHAEQELTH